MNLSTSLKSIFVIIGACAALRSQAAPTEFSTCPGDFYLSIGTVPGPAANTELFEGSPDATGTVNFTSSGPAAQTFQYNSIGFHEPNKFIYGIEGNRSSRLATGAEARLIRVGANGEVVDVGALSGMTRKNYVAGDMDPVGNFYTRDGSTNVIKISNLGAVGSELSGATISTFVLDQNYFGGDIAWVGSAATGSLYSIKLSGSENILYKLNLSSGDATAIGTPFVNSSEFAALWGTPDALYASANDGSGFYQFDLLTGQGTKIANSMAASTNDGARCVSNRPLFPADLSITKTNNQTVYTPGQTSQYTITVTNNGPLGVVGATVTDTLPNGITTTAWTCTSSGGSCTDASGTGSINNTVDLPDGATATFILDMDIPSSFTGQLVNTATVEVAKLGDGSPKTTDDSDLSNNEASDTDNHVSMAITNGHSVPALPWYAMIIVFFSLLGCSRWRFGAQSR